NCRAGKERATFLEHSTNGLESNPLLVREPIHEQDELVYHQAVQILSFLLILRQYPALASVNRAQIAVGRLDRVVVGALEQVKALPQVDFHFEHVRLIANLDCGPPFRPRTASFPKVDPLSQPIIDVLAWLPAIQRDPA